MASDVSNGDQGSDSPLLIRRRARRCRIAAVVTLIIGLSGAGIVYWLGSRAQDYSDDPSMLGFNRAADRQMAILYGKQGQLIEDLNQSLKQPGTQALIIVIAAAVVAAVCFRFSRVLEWEANDAEQAGARAKPSL